MKRARETNNWQLDCAEIKQRGAFLFRTKLWSDIVFQFDSKKSIKAHKLLLAMASPVFGSMFYDSAFINPVKISDVPAEVFNMLLEYIYSDNIQIPTPDYACDLYYAGRQYKVPHITEQCVQYLSRHINHDNVCHIYEITCLSAEEALQEACLNIFRRQTKEVLNSNSFTHAEQQTVVKLFTLDNLNIDSELDLYVAAVKYADANDARDDTMMEYDSSMTSEPSDGATPSKRARLRFSEDFSVSKYNRNSTEENQNNLTKETNRSPRDDAGKSKYRKIVQEIRFLTLTPAEFAECKLLPSLLTEEQILALSLNIASKDTPVKMPDGFSCSMVPRSRATRKDRQRRSATFHSTIHNVATLKKFESIPFYIRNSAWTFLMINDLKSCNSDNRLGVAVTCYLDNVSPEWLNTVKVKVKFYSKDNSRQHIKVTLNRQMNAYKQRRFCGIWTTRLSWLEIMHPLNSFVEDNTLTYKVHVITEDHGVPCDLSASNVLQNVTESYNNAPSQASVGQNQNQIRSQTPSVVYKPTSMTAGNSASRNVPSAPQKLNTSTPMSLLLGQTIKYLKKPGDFTPRSTNSKMPTRVIKPGSFSGNPKLSRTTDYIKSSKHLQAKRFSTPMNAGNQTLKPPSSMSNANIATTSVKMPTALKYGPPQVTVSGVKPIASSSNVISLTASQGRSVHIPAHTRTPQFGTKLTTFISNEGISVTASLKTVTSGVKQIASTSNVMTAASQDRTQNILNLPSTPQSVTKPTISITNASILVSSTAPNRPTEALQIMTSAVKPSLSSSSVLSSAVNPHSNTLLSNVQMAHKATLHSGTLQTTSGVKPSISSLCMVSTAVNFQSSTKPNTSISTGFKLAASNHITGSGSIVSQNVKPLTASQYKTLPTQDKKKTDQIVKPLTKDRSGNTHLSYASIQSTHGLKSIPLNSNSRTVKTTQVSKPPIKDNSRTMLTKTLQPNSYALKFGVKAITDENLSTVSSASTTTAIRVIKPTGPTSTTSDSNVNTSTSNVSTKPMSNSGIAQTAPVNAKFTSASNDVAPKTPVVTKAKSEVTIQSPKNVQNTTVDTKISILTAKTTIPTLTQATRLGIKESCIESVKPHPSTANINLSTQSSLRVEQPTISEALAITPLPNDFKSAIIPVDLPSFYLEPPSKSTVKSVSICAQQSITKSNVPAVTTSLLPSSKVTSTVNIEQSKNNSTSNNLTAYYSRYKSSMSSPISGANLFSEKQSNFAVSEKSCEDGDNSLKGQDVVTTSRPPNDTECKDKSDKVKEAAAAYKESKKTLKDEYFFTGCEMPQAASTPNYSIITAQNVSELPKDLSVSSSMSQDESDSMTSSISGVVSFSPDKRPLQEIKNEILDLEQFSYPNQLALDTYSAAESTTSALSLSLINISPSAAITSCSLDIVHSDDDSSNTHPSKKIKREIIENTISDELSSNNTKREFIETIYDEDTGTPPTKKIKHEVIENTVKNENESPSNDLQSEDDEDEVEDIFTRKTDCLTDIYAPGKSWYTPASPSYRPTSPEYTSKSPSYTPATTSAPVTTATTSAPFTTATTSAPFTTATTSAPFTAAPKSAPYTPETTSAPYTPAITSAPSSPPTENIKHELIENTVKNENESSSNDLQSEDDKDEVEDIFTRETDCLTDIYAPGKSSYTPASPSYKPTSALVTTATTSAPCTPATTSASYTPAGPSYRPTRPEYTSKSPSYTPTTTSALYTPATTSAPYALATTTSASYKPPTMSASCTPATTSAPYTPAETSAPYTPTTMSAPYTPAATNARCKSATASAPFTPAATSARCTSAITSALYTPATSSVSYMPATTRASFTPGITSLSQSYTPVSLQTLSLALVRKEVEYDCRNKSQDYNYVSNMLVNFCKVEHTNNWKNQSPSSLQALSLAVVRKEIAQKDDSGSSNLKSFCYVDRNNISKDLTPSSLQTLSLAVVRKENIPKGDNESGNLKSFCNFDTNCLKDLSPPSLQTLSLAVVRKEFEYRCKNVSRDDDFVLNLQVKFCKVEDSNNWNNQSPSSLQSLSLAVVRKGIAQKDDSGSRNSKNISKDLIPTSLQTLKDLSPPSLQTFKSSSC